MWTDYRSALKQTSIACCFNLNALTHTCEYSQTHIRTQTYSHTFHLRCPGAHLRSIFHEIWIQNYFHSCVCVHAHSIPSIWVRCTRALIPPLKSHTVKPLSMVFDYDCVGKLKKMQWCYNGWCVMKNTTIQLLTWWNRIMVLYCNNAMLMHSIFLTFSFNPESIWSKRHRVTEHMFPMTS